MRIVLLSGVMLFAVSIVGCGGGATSGPVVPPPSAEEKKEIDAAHAEKAKEAGVQPGDSGAPKP